MYHITVIIPAHNTAPYITKCLRSILCQTHRDWDILVIDDASTDSTYSTVLGLVPGHEISVVRCQEHRGLPWCLNYGIRHAQGPIVTVVDSDDMLEPYSLQVGLAPFRNRNVGYVWTNFRTTDGRLGWCEKAPLDDLWTALCKRGWWGASKQQFISKRFYLQSRGLDFDIPYAADLQLALVLAETGCQTQHVPVVTYIYRHPRVGSISTDHKVAQKRCANEVKRRSLTFMEKSKRSS